MQSRRCFGRMRAENKICGSFWEVVAPKACPGGCSTYTTAKAAPHDVIIPFSGPLRKVFLVEAGPGARRVRHTDREIPWDRSLRISSCGSSRPARHFLFSFVPAGGEGRHLPPRSGRGDKAMRRGRDGNEKAMARSHSDACTDGSLFPVHTVDFLDTTDTRRPSARWAVTDTCYQKGYST